MNESIAASPLPGSRPREGKVPTAGVAAKVLVVEDVKALRELCCMMIEDAGHWTSAVENVAQALDILRTDAGAYDVVLTDLTMPGQSGLELIRIIRAEFPLLRTILMSGVFTIDVADAAEDFRPDAVIEKPFSRSDLHAVIAGLPLRVLE